MHTIAVHIRAPFAEPPGAGESGSSFSDDDLLRRQQEQQRIIDAVSPFLSSLPARPLHRAGNVSAVTLLGGDVSSGLWSLLVLVDVDSAAPGLDEELLKVLPVGSDVSVLGSFGRIAAWPEATVAE
jgi:hypothetical protein